MGSFDGSPNNAGQEQMGMDGQNDNDAFQSVRLTIRIPAALEMLGIGRSNAVRIDRLKRDRGNQGRQGDARACSEHP